MSKLILALLLLPLAAFAQVEGYSNAYVLNSAGSLPASAVSLTGVPSNALLYNSSGAITGSSNFTISNSFVSTTGVSVTGYVSSTFYGIDMATASNTQVLYVSGTGAAARMDGALGISYDRITNATFFGTPTGVTPPTPSATVTVSGTLLLSMQRVTPTTTGNVGMLALNTSGTLCIVSPSGVFVKLAAPATNCGFGAGSN